MLSEVEGFEWDDANTHKNQDKHGVWTGEIEQVFFNEPLLLYTDWNHSEHETRWYVLGRTDEWRRLMIVFTVKSRRIRVISARDMSRKERSIYEKEI